MGLATTALIAACVLIARCWFGPFTLGMSVNSPINAETIFAAALVLLLLSTEEKQEAFQFSSPATLTQRDGVFIAALCLGTFIAYWPSLWVEFVADDYAHILAVSKADASYVRDLFTVPATDRFFRPLGMISYLIDVQWAGFNPVKWHLSAVLLHMVNAVLVFALCRTLKVSSGWALFSAAFFSLHGSRPEAVTWIAARFDLVATLFTFATLILFVRYAQAPGWRKFALILLTTLCALLSKESAYVLPLLLGALVLFQPELRNPEAIRGIIACSILTAGTFTYRWFLLNGIGGYLDSQGSPTILSTNVWLVFKALGLRLWAILIFPLNWTDSLNIATQITLTVMVFLLLWAAFHARPSRLMNLGLALVLISSIPVYHLLLIGPDLEKSRVIYLSSAFFGLALGAFIQGSRQTMTIAAIIVTLCFQFLALQHNISTWARVGKIHARACDALAAEAARTEIIAVGMPNTHDGVYMLKTGITECIEVRHGIPANRLHNIPDMSHARKIGDHLPVFGWDEKRGSVTKINK